MRSTNSLEKTLILRPLLRQKSLCLLLDLAISQNYSTENVKFHYCSLCPLLWFLTTLILLSFPFKSITPSLSFFELINFWSHWISCWLGLSLVVASRGYSSLWYMGFPLRYTGFSLWWLLFLWSTGSRVSRLSSYSFQALEQGLTSCWHMGFVALQHVESSQTRDQTCIPYVDK